MKDGNSVWRITKRFKKFDAIAQDSEGHVKNRMQIPYILEMVKEKYCYNGVVQARLYVEKFKTTSQFIGIAFKMKSVYEYLSLEFSHKGCRIR